MMYQIKRCPECGRLYESGIYREKIGRPIASCIFCGTRFLDKSVNEWELRGIGSKIGYLIFSVLDIFAVGMISAMVVILLMILPDLLFKTTFSHFMMGNGNYFIALFAICIVINLIRIVIRESKDFSASKMRMADPQYREEMKLAGLLK